MNTITSILVTHVDQPPHVTIDRQDGSSRTYCHITWPSWNRLIDIGWDLSYAQAIKVCPLPLGYIMYPTPEYDAVCKYQRAEAVYLSSLLITPPVEVT